MVTAMNTPRTITHGACAAVTPTEHVHGGVEPADIRPGDPLSATLHPKHDPGGRAIPAQIWRVSPIGVEIVNPTPNTFGVGSVTDLVLTMGKRTWTLPGLVVISAHEERSRQIVGMRWRGAAALCPHVGERRLARRWRCGAEYFPTGMAANAGRFGDSIYFRILEVSRTGMQLLTSLRNKLVVPGMTQESVCSFPSLGEARVEFQVVDTRVVQHEGKERLCIGVQYTGHDARWLELLGQYLLQFGSAENVQELIAEGFAIHSASRIFDFGWVRSDAEYQEVLELRRHCYAHARKVREDATSDEMGDGFDSRSRIIVAKYRGRIVASVRVMFPQSETDTLKHEEYGPLPASLPPRTFLTEVSKACTHPDFRGSDLFYALIKYAALTAIQARRSHILMSCTDHLVRVYAKVGLRQSGLTYVHPTMGLRHHVMVGDVPAMIDGRGVSPIVWNAMGGYELWTFACLGGVAPMGMASKLRVLLWRSFAPLAFLARWYYSTTMSREKTR